MITPELQADFVRELPEVFLAIGAHGEGWGMNHIRLAQASEEVLVGAHRSRMEAQGRKEYKGEEDEEEEGCFASLALLAFPPLCPACLLSCSNAFASNRRHCALRGD